MSEKIIQTDDALTVANYKGFVKIWQTDPKTGESKVLVDKPNMILYQGADILAMALAGKKNAAISHIYIGYHNGPSGTFTKPIIDKEYTARFQDTVDPFGYLRLPLSFPVSFLSTTGYDNNIGVYTVVISSATKAKPANASFQTSSGGDPSWIYEIALVSALNSANDTEDLVFSRANFEPIQYESGYNLTVSWGVQFLA